MTTENSARWIDDPEGVRTVAKCERGDLNPHGCLAHRILNPARLPVPPLSQSEAAYLTARRRRCQREQREHADLPRRAHPHPLPACPEPAVHVQHGASTPEGPRVEWR